MWFSIIQNMANYNIFVLLSATGTFSGSNRQQNIAVGDTLSVTVNNYISGYRGWNAYIHSSWSSGGTFTPMPAAWTSLYSSGPLVFTCTGQGSGAYQISLYARLPYSPYTYRSGRIYGNVAAGAATYGLSAPSTIQEGSTGTVTISATNNPPGLVYWAATPSADFSPSTGADYLLSNQNGSFSLSPVADNSTEGNETATIRLYSDSARTTQIASTTTTITDQASGGGGGGSTGGSGTAGNTTHGIEVFSQSGTKIFGTDLRTQNLQYELTLSIGAGATSATYAMADANDSTKCVITTLGFAYRNEANRWTINTSSTGFSVTNNGGAGTVDILAFRIG